MDWKVLLVLIVAVVVVGAMVTLGALLSREKKKRAEAEGRAQELKSVAERLVDEAKNKEVPSDEAVKRLNDLINSWNAGDPPGYG